MVLRFLACVSQESYQACYAGHQSLDVRRLTVHMAGHENRKVRL